MQIIAVDEDIGDSILHFFWIPFAFIILNETNLLQKLLRYLTTTYIRKMTKNNLTAVHSGGAYETRTHDLFNAIEAL